MEISFENTGFAFAHKSLKDLKRSRFIFKRLFKPGVISFAKILINAALKLRIPIGWAVKPTVYRYFCGGETLNESLNIVSVLEKFQVKTVLDYAAEESASPAQAEKTFQQVQVIIDVASKNRSIAFAVFKPSSLCSIQTLEKKSRGETLQNDEQKEFDTFVFYVDSLCKSAFEKDVPIMIDAEYISMQDIIDIIMLDMMEKYNKEKAVVFNTLQMYRKDRLQFLRNLFKLSEMQNFYLGIKFVRGAYLEQERVWAKKNNIPTPVHDTKQNTDNDYDDALRFCMEHIHKMSVFSGSHNEKSNLLLVELMNIKCIKPDDRRVYFSQLYGMSDHISFNLAHEGFNVAKYVPFGPVKITIPYLLRRADENKSISGQINRELTLIEKTIKIRQHETGQ